jgi:WD40 repeat protein
MWDLSSGKKMTEFRSTRPDQLLYPEESSMIHALAFSPCGTALATGGDDATVRIWDIRRESLLNDTNTAYTSPHKAFTTRQTMLLDLQYTSRNLLLGVGKYLTPVPLSQRKKN